VNEETKGLGREYMLLVQSASDVSVNLPDGNALVTLPFANFFDDKMRLFTDIFRLRHAGRLMDVVGSFVRLILRERTGDARRLRDLGTQRLHRRSRSDPRCSPLMQDRQSNSSLISWPLQCVWVR